MRMWMINPTLLCRKHLLGEHSEIHKHKHNFEKGHSIKGRLSPVVMVEPAQMEARHDELVQEMLNRGYNHNSPYSLPDLSKYTDDEINAKVDYNTSLRELCNRCEECKTNIKSYGKRM